MPINKKYGRKSPQVGEAGFTLVEMIIVIVISSILGVFVLGVLTKCLVAQINMQERKEMSDEAIMSLERMNRELREAKAIVYAGNNTLMFEKNITSSTDTNLFIRYVRDLPTDRVMRQSAVDLDNLRALWGNSTAGTAIATNVSYFYCLDITNEDVSLELSFTDGSDWQTSVFPRNYFLPP